MAEVIETIEGCIAIIEAMAEDKHDSRFYALIAALRWSTDELDATQQEE